MYFFDLGLIIKFWLVLFIVGLLFLPISTRLFSPLQDKGYILSKVVGIILLSYLMLVLGMAHILPFSAISIFLVLIIYIVVLIFLYGFKLPSLPSKSLRRIWVFEEFLFLVALLFWCYIKGFQPEINGLEKFMDFGFINSILRTDYFPPVDMWFTPLPINYYYFGHLQTALLVKITGIESHILYNIMLSSIFAFLFTGGFSIVYSISKDILKKTKSSIFAGILSALLVTMGGNLHTIYAFFESYDGENPVPFWTLKLLPLDQFGVGYWYPNATRFIQHTIHEFPSYSFVVSDLHGHVLDIPIVLLALAFIYTIFKSKKITKTAILIFSFIAAIMYMTNAWDGIIYMGLMVFVILIKNSNMLKGIKWKKILLLKDLERFKPYLLKSILFTLILGIGFFIFTLPFNLYFKPFASGIGFLCSPEFLEGNSLGPLLFEPDHCQKSPLYQLAILWGFFFICLGLFTLYLYKKGKKILETNTISLTLLLFFFSTLLLIVPEFIYAKDIYPEHYRANTMFKFGYQAYIMMSLISGFAIVLLITKWKKIIFIPLFTILVAMILIYPYFAIRSYFGDITPDRYQGLNGISYLEFQYPEDYEAIRWINENIKGQPVIVEAQGDSYTHYGRISTNTGLPTILGWTVHEWLWRGDYSIPEPRIDEVRAVYEDDIIRTEEIIDKYNVEYIFVGKLEKEKYLNINESKFTQIATPVFSNGSTTIYQVNR